MKRGTPVAVVINGQELGARYLNPIEGEHLVRLIGEHRTSATDQGMRRVAAVNEVEQMPMVPK